jgi:hypothetical protein
MLDFKPLIPTFSRREKELFEFLEIPCSKIAEEKRILEVILLKNQT